MDGCASSQDIEPPVFSQLIHQTQGWELYIKCPNLSLIRIHILCAQFELVTLDLASPLHLSLSFSSLMQWRAVVGVGALDEEVDGSIISFLYWSRTGMATIRGKSAGGLVVVVGQKEGRRRHSWPQWIPHNRKPYRYEPWPCPSQALSIHGAKGLMAFSSTPVVITSDPELLSSCSVERLGLLQMANFGFPPPISSLPAGLTIKDICCHQ